MKLLTKEILKRLPKLGATSDQKDPMVVAKFFDPCGNWTWYAIEFDGTDTFFGAVDGFEFECGTFSLSELQNFRGRFGLGIERDLHWTPRRFSEIKSSRN